MKTRPIPAASRCLLTICYLLAGWSLTAQLNLPRVFSDDMVLQRDRQTRIWGTAPPGTAVNLSLHTQLSLAFADEDGNWEAFFGALPAGGPYDLTVATDAQTIVYENILIGDVWVCAGQSNMLWRLQNTPTGPSEVAASNWPEIRLIEAPNQLSTTPERDFDSFTEWKICSPSTSGGFSALAYYFGRQLHLDLDVPIGLIVITWGGTQIHTWISPEGLDAFSLYDPDQAMVDEIGFEQLQDSVVQAQEHWESVLDADDPGVRAHWQAAAHEWQSWPRTLLPKHWTSLSAAPSTPESYWLKKSFTLTARQADQDAQLHLGAIGAGDQTWINGQLVGRTEHQPGQDREYNVPAATLQAGENIITVRVRNYATEAWEISRTREMSIRGEHWQVSLSGYWHTQQVVPEDGPQQFPPPLSPNDQPSLIYHGMVHPFTRMVMNGVIWYQGESDTGDPFYYRDKQIQIIDDWRAKWDIGNFPFIVTQLPYFRQTVSEPGASSWATLRESQTHALKRDNTSLVTMIDSGHPTNIHPYNKYLTGTRLANHALRLVHGFDNASRGPSYLLDYRSGSAINVIFRTYGSSLFSEQPDNVRAFAIAGEDGDFVWADAEIINNTTVSVSHPSVPDPKYVRYAWSDNPGFVNLFDATGLPVRPFRTDELVTPYE